MKTLQIDQGRKFGKWDDSVSKFMYYTSFSDILERVQIPKKVADYGGGNGILKEFISDIITIDSDVAKQPDIVDNILTHKGEYDLIIIRYVLHYLDDYQVIDLFENILCPVLLIQFVNDDLKSKYQHRELEKKYFRSKSQLEALLPKCELIYNRNYYVTPEFYKNRLGQTGKGHWETLLSYLI